MSCAVGVISLYLHYKNLQCLIDKCTSVFIGLLYSQCKVSMCLKLQWEEPETLIQGALEDVSFEKLLQFWDRMVESPSGSVDDPLLIMWLWKGCRPCPLIITEAYITEILAMFLVGGDVCTDLWGVESADWSHAHHLHWNQTPLLLGGEVGEWLKTVEVCRQSSSVHLLTLWAVSSVSFFPQTVSAIWKWQCERLLVLQFKNQWKMVLFLKLSLGSYTDGISAALESRFF